VNPSFVAAVEFKTGSDARVLAFLGNDVRSSLHVPSDVNLAGR